MKKVFSLLLCGWMLVGLCACNSPESDPIHVYEYVDLGLPSGTLWATCNVGATNPEEAGDYFAWGETKPKENYDWVNKKDYKWGEINWYDATDWGMTKYNQTDGETVIEALDDAATANWGYDWRMPTQAEFQELIKECYWEWDTIKKGYIVMSTVEGNTNSIFLPAAGHCEGTSLSSVGSNGLYWSSTLVEYIPYYACLLSFTSRSQRTDSYYRYSGRSIRPVYSPTE